MKIMAFAGGMRPASVKLSLLGAVVIGAGLSSPVMAQTAAKPAAAPTPEPGEIIVTAQRRAEKLENVPMAISVVQGDALAKAGVTSFQDLGAVVAGAQVNFAGAFTQPTVRGVTTLTNGNNIENNVAVYVDGFYEPSPLVINADLPNLSSIEVLKGPQGTLYGRNATGGAILMNTLAPASTWTGRSEITYARFQDKRASAYVSGPLSDNIRIGVAGYYRHTESYIRLASATQIGESTGGATPIRQAAVRVKLEADLSADIKATVGYNYVHVDDPRSNIFTPRAHIASTVAPPPLRAIDERAASFNGDTYAKASNDQGTLKLEWNVGIGKLTTYTGYSESRQRLRFDNDGTFRDLSATAIRFRQKTFQHAADFTIDAIDNLDLIVGGLYYHDKITDDPFTQSLGINGTVNFNIKGHQTTRAWAVYADATYHLGDSISINVGGRYSDDRKDVDSLTATPAGVAVVGPLSRGDGWSKFTPRATVRYEFAPRTNVYASWSRGFRSGAFNFTPPAVASAWAAVRPETIEAYELGLKTAGRGFRFDVAGFVYNYKDLHVNVASRNAACGPVPAPPAVDTCQSFFSQFQNAPKAEIYGMDTQITVTPVANLNLRAGGAYLHARYKNFINAIGTGLNPVTDTNVINQPQNWSGQQMARAPRFAGNAGFDYNIPMGDGGVMFTGNVNYTDSYVVNNASLFGPLAGALANQQRYRQKHYALVNGTITWTDPTGTYHIGIFGRNLTNRRYRITSTGNSNGDYGSLAEPITYGVRAGFNF
ncbi:TonB-dependent receptor [Sphingomonas naphthae]|uniref:TonB-dependent receptor n=1 Tax=Sphingomonas naphthae TaxID=1813468 RepID=A0ABY7TMN9_9SPHN|nr:TonB-dependent receptor [Sphingomonas naphthae]WCT74434.1 TonB-dependent receptor [Sphingomonas naphthae]